MKKIALLISIVAVAILVAILLLPNDHKKIENIIKKGRNGIKNENVLKIMSLVSRDYGDKYGFTYGALRNAFIGMFRLMDSIEVQYSIIEINIEGDSATALVDVWVSRKLVNGGQDIIGKKHDPERLKLCFVKLHLKWLVMESEWLEYPILKGLIDFPYTLPMREL